MLSSRLVVLLCTFSLLFAVALILPQTVRADARQWGEDGVYLRQGHHIEWQRTSFRNNDGYILLAWSDTRTGDRDIYGQLISPSGAQLWESTGKMLARTREFRQEDPEIVSVNNGWIMFWFDFREDTVGDVWAQKYDMNGDPQWSPNNYTGVRVDADPAAVEEVTLRAVSDGNGGATVAWIDDRRGDKDVFAQHVDMNGYTWPNVLWVTNIENNQTQITADNDGLGNMLVAWQDGRNDPSFPDIWAAKVTPAGGLPWGNIAVCSAPGEQRTPRICPDGNFGCYLAWVDKRSNETLDDIYMARLDSTGQNVWASGGVPVCADSFKQEEVRVAVSLNNGVQDGVIMVWDDYRVNGNMSSPIGEVYSQKYNAAGTALWGTNGFKVCGDATPGGGGYNRSGGRLTSDLSGGMVCAWEDLRNAENLATNSDIYAAHVLANGTHAWGQCGLTVVDSAGVPLPGAQWGPLVRVNGDTSGVIIFWSDKRSGSQSLRYQNMDFSNGSRTLQPDGVQIVYGLDGNAARPRSTPMTLGRVGVVWEDNRLGPGGTTLYYQVIDSTGHVEREQNGRQLVPNNTSGSQFSQQFHEICQDGSNGFFVSFIDTRWGTKLVRVAHVNEQTEIVSPDSGALVWWTPGIRDQQDAYISPDGQGGCYVAWSGYASNFWIDIYVMRLNANLERAWQTPVRLSETFPDDILHGIITDPTGCCVAVWQSGDLGDYNINAARVCADGTVAWNNLVCNAPGDQDNPALFADGLGGTYFAWADGRNEQQELDIYAQHVQVDGSVTWAANGVQVISYAQNQNQPALEVDSNHNLYVVWQDFRSGTDTDIYGQKLSPTGTMLWPATGKPICIAGGQQNEQVLASEWANGLYVVWTDARGYHSDIYATHINESGQWADPYWQPDSGGVVMDFFHIQDAPSVASDGHGGVITSWQDYRASGKEPLINIWAQWINDYTVSVDEIPNAAIPSKPELGQNYPNPFNPTTQIRFSIPVREAVKITLYNTLGQVTATLVDEVMNAGTYSLNFEARGLPSGTYFYRLNTASFETVRKMVLLR